PDHSTLSRRAETLVVAGPPSSAQPVHLLVDSTGLKLSGAGEWLVEKHGTSRRRSWRKLHIGVDADTGRIVAAALTTNDVDDGSQVGPLLDQIDDPIASLTGDGAYDQDGVYGEVAARHPDAAVIVPPRSSGVPSETAESAPTPRDRHLQAIAKHGRMGWQKASGYNWRALVEADIGRWKRVIGHALRSQTNERQAAEVAIAVDVLNRMLELGRPSYVPSHETMRAWDHCVHWPIHATRCVLDALLPHVLERVGELVADLVAHHPRDADAARFGQCLQPRRDVDTVAVKVVALDDHIAEIDPNAEGDALVIRDIRIAVD